MLARYARRVLYVELAAYALAAVLSHRAGWPTVFAAVLGFALCVRLAGVAASFAVAAGVSQGEHGVRLSAAEWLRVAIAETACVTLAYTVLMPFPRAFSRADSRLRPAAGTLPVLLVHGYLCNGAIWTPMRRFLEARGVPAFSHDLEPVHAGIDDYVDALAERIEAVCRTAGTERLVVVGHSMGGLVVRACLRKGRGARIAKLVTLGTGHRGSRMARFGQGENARQMEWGSAWIRALEQAEHGAPAVPVTSIYSPIDNLIVPRESAVLQGAKNLRAAPIGHVSLAFAPAIREMVLDEIRSP